MARNEEKQQGRLNRLWLEKEREEGRLKDVHERRPKLSTLNAASSVKKWIPSIKNEIEYYLQQSQLSHYPERKIAEFQLHIEALEREYKSFISKLRVLDPACKHKPWTPRAYSKRRADTRDSPVNAKNPRPCESHGSSSQQSEDTQGPLTHLRTRFQTPVPTNLDSETPEAACADQDQPLTFDHTKLAVAAAAFRGPSVQRGSSETQSLARVLQSGLPNLVNASLRKTFSPQVRDAENETKKGGMQDCTSDCEGAEGIPGKSSNPGSTEERTGHVLGLDCYSSSDDEECDT
ncbi:hypothetical protein GBF38_018704 [Nibea albiflora]|uniref:Uncharacterized protein n=1 Tax=Nibea albiflora TaxID=240163 RepID=A0ACB7EMW0_NIBAL|nr:hypothetical protein GBF38_018704 [Nibea albiflora]